MASNNNAFDREKAIELAIGAIEKQFGKGSIMRLGEDEVIQDIPVISTGAIGLDVALGIGGVPRGRVVEIYGPESSGKTTLALHVVAEAQKKGGIAAFVDAEHALDTLYARKLGVRTDDLLISQPDTGEQALEITEMLVRSNAVDVLVIDSVAALVPRAEIEGEMGDAHVGLQARLMSQALRKLTGVIAKSRTCVIFINQIRMKIGVMFGSPETTTGGNALKFYASIRMDIRRIGAIKDQDAVLGNRTRVKVVKNKLAPPFREHEFDILYGEGISRSGDLLDLGTEVGIIDKAGSWYSYQGERIGQGREQSKETLKSNTRMASDIEERIRLHFGLVPSPIGDVIENTDADAKGGTAKDVNAKDVNAKDVNAKDVNAKDVNPKYVNDDNATDIAEDINVNVAKVVSASAEATAVAHAVGKTTGGGNGSIRRKGKESNA